MLPKSRFSKAVFGHSAGSTNLDQQSPRQTKPKKGPKRKVHEFRPFLWILFFFCRKTSTIHIELLFRNALQKVHELTLVWFAGATPDWTGPIANSLLVRTRPLSYQTSLGVITTKTFLREGKSWSLVRTKCPGKKDIFKESYAWDSQFSENNYFRIIVFVSNADFREGDEDSNFSLFRVRQFTEWPGPLHWIAFPVEILTTPPIHWIASPLFTANPFFSLKRASSHDQCILSCSGVAAWCRSPSDLCRCSRGTEVQNEWSTKSPRIFWVFFCERYNLKRLKIGSEMKITWKGYMFILF